PTICPLEIGPRSGHTDRPAMTFSLKLSRRLAAHWKVKIRDKERNEEPHVTVFRKEKVLRISLRQYPQALASDLEAGDLPKELWNLIEDALPELRRYWDATYPENPIDSSEDEE